MSEHGILNQIRRLRFDHQEMTQQELADALGVSLATVNRDLSWAKDWLKADLGL